MKNFLLTLMVTAAADLTNVRSRVAGRTVPFYREGTEPADVKTAIYLGDTAAARAPHDRRVTAASCLDDQNPPNHPLDRSMRDVYCRTPARGGPPSRGARPDRHERAIQTPPARAACAAHRRSLDPEM